MGIDDIKDSKRYELTDEDWEINELKDPYGAYRLKYYDSVAYECGSLESEQNSVELLVQVREQDNIELFTISRFVDGEIKIIHVIDNEPKEAK